METKTLLKFAELQKLATDASPEFMQMVKAQLGMKKTADTARDSYRENIPYAGKLTCVARVQFDEMKAKGGVPKTIQFKDYFKGIYGDEPDTRVSSCSNTYASYVLTAKITEEVYDGNPVDALQRASRIVSAVNHDLTHPAVAEVASLLPKLDTKKLKKLARIQARIQEVTTGEGEKAVTTIKFLTEEELDKQLANPGVLETSAMAATLCSTPTGLGACIQELVAIGRTTENKESARALCHLQVQLMGALAENVDPAKARRFPVEQLEAWGRELTTEIKVITAPPAPAAPAPENKKARKRREADEAAAAANTIQPADIALLNELEAPIEAPAPEPQAAVSPDLVTAPEEAPTVLA